MAGSTYISPFGHTVSKNRFRTVADKHLLAQYGLELDKETGNTKAVITGNIDLTELIQSYKDQCGIEYALKLIKTGMAVAADFADDGKHGVDASYPTDVNTLNAMSSTARGAEIIRALGITDDMSSQDIANAIVAALKKSEPAPEVKPYVNE